MGFWHTGYFEFHEPEEPRRWSEINDVKLAAPSFRCQECDVEFATRDELAIHEFEGHSASRPRLLLNGRECGRSRFSIITPTKPSDWTIKYARRVRINGRICSPRKACDLLAGSNSGVVSVVLEGEVSQQEFEFSFDIANEEDLDGIDDVFYTLIAGRLLSHNVIDGFISSTAKFVSGRKYRDGIANYLYGALAREHAGEVGVGSEIGAASYRRFFDDAVRELGRYNRGPAEAISGLVAFHYNHFGIALLKTRSPRIAQVSLRFAHLLEGHPGPAGAIPASPASSLDYVLSDSAIERIIRWCSIPLDGTAGQEVADLEGALGRVQPEDETKLRMVAAEHYLAAGEPAQGERHLAALRHSVALEKWIHSYRTRAEGRSE